MKQKPYSVFPGVHWHIRKNGYEVTWKQVYLGTFLTEAKALMALANHLEALEKGVS